MKFTRIALLFLFVFAPGVICSWAQTALPEFQELYQTLKNKLPDVSEEELSRAAAVGMLKEMGPRVRVVTNQTETVAGEAPGINRKELFAENIVYVRVGEVVSNLGAEFGEAWESLARSNQVKGLILDLRYAGGEAYEAAGETADYFLPQGTVMLEIGDQVKRASKPEQVTVPVAILVNEKTSGAGEVLAGILREHQAGIVIGERTAGQARISERVKLSSGLELLVGTTPVKVGRGDALSKGGLAPDIFVRVEPEQARAWYDDPYRVITPMIPASTNQLSSITATNRNRRTLNEAELVRRHRQGLSGEAETETGPENGPPAVVDPVLGRALDFLKGINSLKHLRQP